MAIAEHHATIRCHGMVRLHNTCECNMTVKQLELVNASNKSSRDAATQKA